MKPFLIFSLFLFISVCYTQASSNLESTRDFPPCEEVLSFAVKNLKELPSSGQSLSLAKKPKGYFLVITNFKDRKPESQDYIQLWNRETGKYTAPKLTGIESKVSREEGVNNYFSSVWTSLHKYDFLLYCGYPDSNTDIVTDLHLKIANERMSFWSHFVSVQEPELARKMLEKVNYSASDLAVAKRMLDNCAQNSFLFTSGDNDTFPLWYLQEKEEYRSDVTVMNTSLMQTDWYLSMCKATGNYKTSLTKRDYHNFISMVVMPRSEGETSIQAVLADSLAKLNGVVPAQGYLLVPSKLSIQLGEESTVELENESYLYLWKLALLDILNSNPERTFYSGSSYGMIWRNVGLDGHFATRAILSELIDGSEIVGSMDEESPEYLRNTLDKIDLKQINQSYLSSYELRIFMTTLTRLKYDNRFSFEDIGRRLINELDIDELAKIDNPLVLTEALAIYDELDPEQGILLREKYNGQAQKLIDMIDDSGVNFMEKAFILSEIYTMYSGESIRSYYQVDSYNESINDQLVIRKIMNKVRAIKKNIDPNKMIKTFERLGPYVEKLGIR